MRDSYLTCHFGKQVWPITWMMHQFYLSVSIRHLRSTCQNIHCSKEVESTAGRQRRVDVRAISRRHTLIHSNRFTAGVKVNTTSHNQCQCARRDLNFSDELSFFFFFLNYRWWQYSAWQRAYPSLHLSQLHLKQWCGCWWYKKNDQIQRFQWCCRSNLTFVPLDRSPTTVLYTVRAFNCL